MFPRHSPEWTASLRRRYEETDEPVALIAIDFEIDERNVYRIATQQGWRKRSAARGLPRLARLSEAVQALAAQYEAEAAMSADADRAPAESRANPSEPETEAAMQGEERAHELETFASETTHSTHSRVLPGSNPGSDPAPGPSPGLTGGSRGDERNTESPQADETPTNTAPPRTDAPHPPAAAAGAPTPLERLERILLCELELEERRRASLGSKLLRPAEALRASRALSILTHALQTIERTRRGHEDLPSSHHDEYLNDDIPRDIDEFRRELARRIDAFVASRTDPANAEGDPRPRMVDEAP